MTEDEKRGFEHCVFGFVSSAKRDVENMTELYATHGYEAIMQSLESR